MDSPTWRLTTGFFSVHADQNMSIPIVVRLSLECYKITTKDPKTFEYYSDVDSEAFWMPFRYVGCKSRPWDFSN